MRGRDDERSWTGGASGRYEDDQEESSREIHGGWGSGDMRFSGGRDESSRFGGQNRSSQQWGQGGQSGYAAGYGQRFNQNNQQAYGQRDWNQTPQYGGSRELGPQGSGQYDRDWHEGQQYNQRDWNQGQLYGQREFGRQGYGGQHYGQGLSGSYGGQQGGLGGMNQRDFGQGNYGSFGQDGDFGMRRQNQTGERATMRGPKGYTRSDDRIREDVSDQLGMQLDASEIEVAVNQGEITLTGTVESRQLKFQAEEICDRISGVKDVINNLRVQRADQKNRLGQSGFDSKSDGGKQADESGMSRRSRPSS